MILDDTNYALADFDNDGLDEIVTVSNGTLSVQKKNTGITRSGFPLYNNFIGIPLIADTHGSSEPEIICKTTTSILVISDSGDIIEQLPLYDSNHDIILIPHNSETYLINGNRSYKFPEYNSG